ncbi:sigma-54-dependent Fis family transcriptional regulator [Bacillus sp. JJ1562]|uniref:sigma-54-dependent Fis family transcriptional regulator n=1 Tax=Bacillus sp. JJ1562 TaxID=3122960 RepID=UPI003002B8E7
MKSLKSYKENWEQFIYEDELKPTINPIVRLSWLRSKKMGIDPFRTYGKIKSLDLEKYKELINLATPLTEGLYSIVEGSGFMVIICNEQGQLLKVIGDKEPLNHANMMGFIEGADWSEEEMGTNAIGTSIVIDSPLQIVAEEHYAKVCQSWTCSAAPIHDSNGKIIGVLNMSGPREKVHSHTLGMVMSTVKAIEYQLKLHENMQNILMMQKFLEAATNNIDDAIVITDTQGKIIISNEQFTRLFDIKKEQQENKKLSTIFENQILTSTNKVRFLDKEIYIKRQDLQPSIHCMVSKIPIYQDNKWLGSMITLKEMKKVRHLVNHLTDHRAKVSFGEIIGESRTFLDKVQEAKLAAKTSSTVLILGESGTGKDMIAQAIHNASNRKNKPFISINCGGIPRDLLGSELFGYEEGAFTGAKKGGRQGKFELADGGTLFLDEIGEMSLEMQVLLLRVLQDREVIRIGGQKVISVDVRIIAATNRNLRKEVEKGSFREDLFFRLNVMPIELPPLRNRIDDIPLLVELFIRQFSKSLNRSMPVIEPGFIHALMQYRWPGNIRELQNILERTMNKSLNDRLTSQDLPNEIFENSNQRTNEETVVLDRNELKKQAIIHALKKNKGNILHAAKYLGIARSTLYRQMKKFNIQ